MQQKIDHRIRYLYGTYLVPIRYLLKPICYVLIHISDELFRDLQVEQVSSCERNVA